MRTEPQLWTTRHVLALAHSQNAGSLFRIGREALGWRQADLGKRLLCSQSAVSRLEQG
ncbi:multiprotein-bridging factor 1 family protein [Streptomyces erythrochromogenes]|uniref:helix-turn-helix domain-containing protein n=1 Tax=Streptomyces erythrochromogenes TaxID=285574 RepID=UPI0036AD81B5